MSWLDFFKRKEVKSDSLSDSDDILLPGHLEWDAQHDFLGKAAIAGHNARQAVKEKRYDEAWRQYHWQKIYYMRHCNTCCRQNPFLKSWEQLEREAGGDEELGRKMDLAERTISISTPFTVRQILALDGSVSEGLANILRLEQKHDEALTHMLYCLMSSNSPTKSQQTKIVAYFNRCKFNGIGLEELNGFISSSADLPDLRTIQAKVKEWRTRS